jgi:two-component system, chemotaxis family, response regulator PixG
MNSNSSTSSVLEQKSNPIELLESLAASQKSGCLRVRKDAVTYLIDLDRGHLTYATHSLDPFERLERHLRRLSHQVPQLTPEVRTQARLNFADKQETDSFADYRAIYWSIEQQYLTHQQAQLLIKNIAREVLESLLSFSGDFEVEFLEIQQDLPLFCKFEITVLLSECQKTLQGWSKFSEQIISPYQRPYFFANAQTPPAQTEKLGKILKGFNFRQLAAILNQDELLLAEKLYPLILNKSIVLRDASPPFDRLPKLPKNIAVATTTKVDRPTETASPQSNGAAGERDDLNLGGSAKTVSKDRPWKIACIDDSPTILNEMNRFLGSDEFEVVTIDDPLKALMKIIRLEPDIILLDVGMPNIDGYKLCALIRKYSAFKDTPIVMVTGNKGLIDRAKAKLAGATDYMTKPFTQSELLDMVFRYLS